MSGFLNVRGRRRERERQAQLTELSEQRSQLRQHLYTAIELTDGAEALAHLELEDSAAELLAGVESTLTAEYGAWSSPGWSSWRADTTSSVTELRVGSLVEESGASLGLPIVVELGADAGPIVILSRNATERAAALELLGSLVVRLHACLPKQVRLVLLDPAGSGAAFPMSRRLDQVLLGFDDVHRPLDELRSEIARISAMYLDRRLRSFDELPPTLRLGEMRQVLLGASVPERFDEEAVDSLVEIATNGPKAGINTILHLDLETGPDAPELLERLVAAGATVLDLAGTPAELGGLRGTVAFDELPSGAVQESIFQRVAAAPRRDVTIPWESVQEFELADWWLDTSESLMAAAVGRAGADDIYDIWFGHDPESSRSCTHGIVIGAAPTGRQFAFDAILAGLATHLPPSELRVFLVESADHPSFLPWKALPHAEVIALAPSAEQARHAVAELRAICERRLAELHRSGSATYNGRRTSTSSTPTMPRMLAIVDGYEQLFVGDDHDRAIDDLRQIIALGETVGVHLVLGGSRFDATAPLHRAGLFDELDLRLALQPFADDTLGRDEFGVKGVRLVKRVCDRPFRAVVNTTRGHDDANLAMQLAALDPNRRDQIITRLAEMARTGTAGNRGAHVLNGGEQPQLIDNPYLQRILDLPRTTDAIAEFARSSPINGGLGIDDWADEERPLLMFIGQEETVHGQAHFVLRRRPTENVLVLMADRDVRIGTLAALLVSSALIEPEDVEFWIADRSPTGTPAGNALEHAVRRIAKLDMPCRYTRSGDEAADFIGAVAGDVARRRTLAEREVHELPSTFLVLVEPERIAALNRVPTAQGTTDSEVGVQLRYILMQGPAVGVHVIVAASAMAALTTAIAEPVIHHDLRHRLVAKVAEEDSFALVRSSRAATLSDGRGHALAAVMFDSHTQAATTFKPYSVVGSESGRVGPMSAQLTQLFDRLTEEEP